MVGTMMALVAIPWFVLQTTGSAARTGVVTAVASLPLILGGALGGALVDRVGSRRMSILADLASGTAVMLIPLLFHTVGLAFWHLLVLVFLRGLLDAPGNTARAALLPDLADHAGVPREPANAASQGIQRGATLLGPPIAGVLIGFIGPSHVLWLDAGSFAVSALFVAITVPAVLVAARPHAPQARHYFQDLRDGLRFIRRDGLMLAIALNNAASNFFDGFLSIMLPVYAKDHLGSAVDLGLMFAGLGAGALVSIVLFGRFGPQLSRRLLFGLCLAGVGIGFGLLASTPGLIGAMTVLALAGLAAGPINPVLMTVYQERTPPALRGRVFGLTAAIALSAMPIGRLAGGYLIEGVGLQPAIAVSAGGYLVAGLVVLLVPVYTAMDRRRSPLS